MAGPSDRSRAARRSVLRAGGATMLGVGLMLSGCASRGLAPRAGERLIDLRSGCGIRPADLLAAMRASDRVLLGERHDNPRHHALRGALVEALGAPARVVAEHLPRGARVQWAGGVEAGLREAGFDAPAWRWPLHQPLFEAVARSSATLVGGNLPRDEVRRIAREGEAAWPADVAQVLMRAPLSPAAQDALDADLLAGHCGHIGVQRLPGMRAAQRARDAAMWLALHERPAAPAVLLAGNGHVRLDYGVGQLVDALEPQARRISVGFLETGEAMDGARTPYTHAWITAPAERDDPCAAFEPIRRPSNKTRSG